MIIIAYQYYLSLFCYVMARLSELYT